MDADRTIARIAAAQHSAVARRQLLQAGVGRHVVDHRVAKGLLVPTHPGVYRLAGSPPSWHQRIMAATLAAGRVRWHPTVPRPSSMAWRSSRGRK